jgi:hypothetical protein
MHLLVPLSAESTMRLDPEDLIVTSFGTSAELGDSPGTLGPPTPGTGCGWCPPDDAAVTP